MTLSINKDIKGNIEFLKECYSNNKPDSNDNYFQLITSPFKVLKLKNFLSYVNYRKDLTMAVLSLPLYRKSNDLYTLWQSEDLHNSGLKPVKKFINLLEKEVRPLLSEICGVELTEKISLTASLYKEGDVLLCHDDRCEDRCIAFIYYLKGCTDCGGTFDMFAHDENMQPSKITHSMFPEENALICFEVGNLTYHQVSEVTCSRFERWSIGGWFHSKRQLPPEISYVEPVPTLQDQEFFEIITQNLIKLKEYIPDMYVTKYNIGHMRHEFVMESTLLLKDVFLSRFFRSCLKELTKNDLNWKRVGPANRKNYFVADMNHLPPTLNTLVSLLKSPIFVSHLKEMTNLSLVPRQARSKNATKLTMELIRWSAGCYTMVTDNDAFFQKPGLDLYIFFDPRKCTSSSKNSCGYITYLDTSDSVDTDSERELITIVPENNAMALVYRTDKTVRYTKYINHFRKGEYYAIYATYYEVEEKPKSR